MKLGADRKRIAILAVLVLVAGVALYSSFSGGDSAPSRPMPQRQIAVPTVIPAGAPAPATARQRSGRPTASEFKPVVRDLKNRDQRDPMTIDPTLRLDVLAKVQGVALSASSRNLFQFGSAAEPGPVKPLVNPGRIAIARPPIGPAPPPSASLPLTPVIPQAPPIPLKYYGYSSARADGRKRAFFLDGDDILVATEGELVKKRYRLVRVGVNSVTMEDVQFTGQQTLPMTEEAAS